MPVLQRGDPEAAVFLRIDLASRTHEAGGKNAKDARHYLLARKPRQTHPPIDGLRHVVDRQERGAHGHEGLHLDAGAPARPGGRLDLHGPPALLEADGDRDVVEGHGVA